MAGDGSKCRKIIAKLNFNPENLGRFCREHGIARLELFGSPLRADFQDESDVDLLAKDAPAGNALF
jgi:predicted nucleotidyltransferase